MFTMYCVFFFVYYRISPRVPSVYESAGAVHRDVRPTSA